jgi:signal transduction histidine kinase
MTKLALQTLAESSDPDEIKGTVAKLCKDFDQMIEEVHSLTFELGNPVLYEIGLAEAVESWLETQLRDKHGIAFEFKTDEELPRIDDELKLVLFRNARELLNNVVKHARASNVFVCLRSEADDLCIEVEDDGVGFHDELASDAQGEAKGFGLFSVKEHVRHLGGSLEVEPRKGGGTRVVMTVPISGPHIAHHGREDSTSG